MGELSFQESEVEHEDFHRCDDEINVASEWPELPESCPFKSCLPGRIAVLMGKPREDVGGIILTDRTGGNLRPDGGVIACVGDGVPLRVGTRGYIRPYVGMWTEFGGDLYRLIGRELFEHEEKVGYVPWSDHFLCTHDGDEILPTPGNLICRFDQVTSSIILTKPMFKDTATIIHAGSLVFKEGQRIVANPGCEKMTFKLGPFSDDVFLIKEDDVRVVLE